MIDWDIHKHNQQLREEKGNYHKCLTCDHKKKSPKQFPCTCCVHLQFPCVHLSVEVLDYYEEEGKQRR